MGLFLSCLFLANVWGQTSIQKPGEKPFVFPKTENSQQVEFRLMSKGVGKFDIELKEPRKMPTRIKIYNILGDLIIEDVLTSHDGMLKSYDFSGSNYKLFVVEVGNSKYNNTRSIYHSPPGQKKVNRL